MGVKLGDAIVYFKGDKTHLQQAQRESHRETKAWTVALGSLISSGITLAAQTAAKAILGIGKAGLQAAIDAMPIEGIRSAFQGITGDADAMLATLRKGSLGMVRDAELMRSYNEAAQLVNKQFADQLPDAMQYLSKVSAATGQDMGFMIDSLTKGVGRLSPMILDNLGIQASLAEATEAAAKKFGVQTDALSKAQIQAGMMDVVLQKLKENTAAMPDVTENAATKWARFKTIVGNLKDMLGEAAIPVLLALIEPVSELAEKHGPKLVEWAQSAGEWLGKKIPQGIELARSAIRRLSERGLKGVALDLLEAARARLREVDWRELALSILRRLAEGVVSGYAVVRNFVINLRDNIRQRISEVDWGAVWQSVKGWGIGLVTSLAQSIQETDWSAVGQAILNKISTTFESIKQAASEKARGLLSGIFGGGGGEEGESGGEGAGGLTGILDAISGFVSGPGGTALSVIGAIVGLLTGVGAPIAIVIGLVKLLSAAWESNFGGIRDFTMEALGTVNGWIDKGKEKVQEWLDRIKSLAVQFQSSVQEGIGPFFDRAREGWQWITQVALPVLHRWGQAFMRGLQPHIERIWELLQKFIADIQPDLKLLWGELLDAWSEISTVVKEELWPAIQELLEELGINTDSVEDFAEVFGDFVGTIIESDLKLLLGGIRIAVRGLASSVRIAKGQILLIVDGITALVDIVRGGVEDIKLFASGLSELTGIKIPEWLQMHSPPPLASALAQIAEAARALPDLNGKLGGVISPRMGSQYTDSRRYLTMYGTSIYPTTAGGGLNELMEASLVR